MAPKTRVEVVYWIQKHVLRLFIDSKHALRSYIGSKNTCRGGFLIPWEACWGGLLAPGDRGCASSILARCPARNWAVGGSIPCAAWAALGAIVE